MVRRPTALMALISATTPYPCPRPLRMGIAFMLVALLALLWSQSQAVASVTLSYFQAEADDSSNSIVVTWGTETEVDTILFRLWRSTRPDPDSATQVAQEGARGSAVTGSSYEYVDDDLNPGQTYYYWLYEVTSQGNVKPLATSDMVDGYITAVAPAAPPRATATRTATPTTSATLVTPTPTAQQTATPTATPTPSLAPTATKAATQPGNDDADTTDVPAALTPTSSASGSVRTSEPADTPSTSSQPTIPATVQASSGPSPVGQSNPTALPQATPVTATTPVALAFEKAAGSPTPERGSTPTATFNLQESGREGSGDRQPDSEAASPEYRMTPSATPHSASGSARLPRPTATPRIVSSERPDNTRSLLTVVGAGGLCGAGLLALAALFVWRRR